jgi:hypothetical protein
VKISLRDPCDSEREVFDDEGCGEIRSMIPASGATGGIAFREVLLKVSSVSSIFQHLCCIFCAI